MMTVQAGLQVCNFMLLFMCLCMFLEFEPAPPSFVLPGAVSQCDSYVVLEENDVVGQDLSWLEKSFVFRWAIDRSQTIMALSYFATIYSMKHLKDKIKLKYYSIW